MENGPAHARARSFFLEMSSYCAKMSCVALQIEAEAHRIELVSTPRSLVMAARRGGRHSRLTRHRIETTWRCRETTW